MKLRSFLLFLLLSCSSLKALEYNDPLWVENNGMTFWSESLGEWSDKKAIILIAGVGANGRFWPDFFCEKLVKAGYFVIRYDHREVGLSNGCKGCFEVEDLADDVVAILDAYKIPQAHVVGLSMGGMVTQFVAANYPDRVKSQTLIATSPVGATARLDLPLTFSETITLTNTLHFLSSHLVSSSYQQSLPAMYERYAYFNGKYPLDKDVLDFYIWNIYHRTLHAVSESNSNQHLQNVQRMMSTLNDRRDIFKKMQAPTLIIHGALDNLILMSRGGLALQEAIQGSVFKIYPKMGHGFFNRELLDCLSRDILTFIKNHETA